MLNYRWLPLVLIVFLLLIVGPLLREGMFYDGLIYASISRNMALGEGSFWLPHFTMTDDNVFHSHPPLAFWLESLPFYLTGDSIYGERIYEIIITALHAFLIGYFWRIIATSNEIEVNKVKTDEIKTDEIAKKSIALPILFWFFVPSVAWGAANNLLENTMTFFTTAAITCIFLFLNRLKTATKTGIPASHYLYLAAAACFILLGFGSKGMTALFPLGSIFFYYFCFKNTEKAISFWSMIGFSGVLNLLFWAFFGAVLWFIPDAYRYLNDYLTVQVVNSVTSVKTVSSHYAILLFTANNVLTMLIVSSFVGFVYYKNKKLPFLPVFNLQKPEIYWTLCVAFSAFLPITVSLKQSDFYALGCFPFFAICASLWVLPAYLYAQNWIEKQPFWKKMPFINTAAVLASFVFALTYIGVTRSSEAAGIHDIRLVAKQIPRNELIGVCAEVRDDWTFSCYGMRYEHLNIDINPNQIRNYFVLTSNEGVLPQGAIYEQIQLDLKTIRLYKRVQQSLISTKK